MPYTHPITTTDQEKKEQPMSVDLRTAKPGDILVSKNGTTHKYDRYEIARVYPHICDDAVSFKDDGTYDVKAIDDGLNIVKIIPQETKKESIVTEELINMTDSYTYRGDPARVIAINGVTDAPVMAVIDNTYLPFTKEGRRPNSNEYLMKVPKTIKCWVNVMLDMSGKSIFIHDTEQEALDNAPVKKSFAAVAFPVEIPEGYGVPK
jgi:hypothetical protein